MLYDLRVDPRYADFADQVLEQAYSKLGREDLAAASSDEYQPARCEADASGIAGEEAIVDEIGRWAADTRVVIINESHTVSRHRGFSRRVAERLRGEGFTHFAAETFAHPADRPAPVEEGIGLSYPRDQEGNYLVESAFGRLWRSARALSYIPVAYEQNTPLDESASMEQRILAREAFQAAALAEEIETAGPDARFFIHVGLAHASEDEVDSEPVWMAGRLKALTGIDPLTISQFQCRQDGGAMRLADPVSDPTGESYDMIIDHPVTQFVGHRPLWRSDAGDMRIPVPAGLVPIEGAYVVEARLAGEPNEAIPMDRVLVRAGEQVDLLLPPGHYRLRAVVAIIEEGE